MLRLIAPAEVEKHAAQGPGAGAGRPGADIWAADPVFRLLRESAGYVSSES